MILYINNHKKAIPDLALGRLISNMTSNLDGSEYYTKYIVIIKINVNTYLYFLAIEPTTIHFIHFCSFKPDLFLRQNPINGVLFLVDLAGRYSNPHLQQVLESLLSLNPSESDRLLCERNAPSMQVQTRLTKDEIKQVVKSYKDGVSMGQLAKIWGIHRTKVSSHIKKSGVPRRY